MTTTTTQSGTGNANTGSNGGGSSGGTRRKRSSEGDFIEEDTIRLACEEGFLFNPTSIQGDGIVEVAEEDRSTEILVNDNDGANKVMKPNGEMEVEIECLHSSNWSANPTCYLVQVGFLLITFFLICLSV